MTTHVEEPTRTGGPDRSVAAALAGAAAASAAAPVVDAGPLAGGDLASAILAWRWVVGTEALDLYAGDATAQHWRATCVGAGGALHRARVALAAEGLAAQVTLLPDAPERSHAQADQNRGGVAGRARTAERGRRGTPETPLPATHAERKQQALLARLVAASAIEVTPEARALFAATAVTGAIHLADASRPADRTGGRGRRIQAPGRDVVRELVGAARAEGARLRVIRDGAELIGVLHGPDTREAWLRAGMACSAVGLVAHRLGLNTVTALVGEEHAPPRWQTHPGRQARAVLRRIGDREGWLGVGIGTPYVRLRLTPPVGALD